MIRGLWWYKKIVRIEEYENCTGPAAEPSGNGQSVMRKEAEPGPQPG